MADPRYNALITIWPSIGTGGSTTDQKLAILNAMNVTGSIPQTINVTGDQILNSISWPEFNAIATATIRNELLTLCTTPGQLLGGSSNTTHMLVDMLLANFTVGSVTIANLTALAKASTVPWWLASVASGGGGLSSPVSGADLAAAGGLT